MAKDINDGAHAYPNYQRKGRAYVYYGNCDAACWRALYEKTKAELEECLNPTLVEMSSIKAIPANEKITLAWKTDSEVDNAGFNVWRAEGFQKITPAMIPAEGSPTGGAVYNYLDELLNNGKPYFYLIEDVDTKGIATFHGPVKATPRLICGIGER